MPPLNVVALISGGKDSLFSIQHCIANGHCVVALANLHPEQTSTQDIDSFMYQTVGHNVIELIGQALELPLYRQPISGSATSTSKTYSPEQTSDEVECMHTLLTAVKSAHPEVNAVCSGAILSDYQRTRVESVAIRLGLTPLSYLWQFPFLPPYKEEQLLYDMAETGQDSRIIKVASGSLDESMLWSNVANARTISRLMKASSRFGELGDGSTIGEGGEYETLTLDGPPPLWKHRIQVREGSMETLYGEGGTATLKLLDAVLVAKEPENTEGKTLRIPDMFDGRFDAVRQAARQANRYTDGTDTLSPIEGMTTPQGTLPITTCSAGEIKQLANLTHSGATAEEQAQGIINDLREIHQIDPSTINHTTILLKSMADFPTINKIYGSFFTTPNPPSRVTIACGPLLPPTTHISLSLTHSISLPRAALHVQSQSYWAPANIGPYSQAISLGLPSPSDTGPAPSLVHIAGQIPLIPATMEMYTPQSLSPSDLALEQTLLSAQHLSRIAQTMKTTCLLGGVLCIGRDAVPDPLTYVQAGAQVWAALHSPCPTAVQGREAAGEVESDDEVDVWDVKHGLASRGGGAGGVKSLYRDTIQRDCITPFFAAEVQGLPRGAGVEWGEGGEVEGGVGEAGEGRGGVGRCGGGRGSRGRDEWDDGGVEDGVRCWEGGGGSGEGDRRGFGAVFWALGCEGAEAEGCSGHVGGGVVGEIS
ncbi:hypothetical protein BDZ85DRAFT_275072 [Elsinoe ampelina]|uniref:Diphthine--ammonia ligase n=1 Tax=Elsinoe ampelina TaxID=302913 RepID=A0A6A6G6I6_9PEZI|nr:hypothetical protein BDZ85DRAFT_275072 [Elsinoe ampelina]